MPSRFYKNVIALSKTPGDFQHGQVVEIPKPTTIVAESLTTVVAGLSTTVVAGNLWRAELNGSLFPPSRVRRIERAQDALTHAEECVYDCLWGPKNTAKDESRIAQIGYDRIAKAARITKRNAALIVERLIEKGFVQLETAADPLHRVPSQYRVFGYRAALEGLTRRGRQWVVRSGNGVLFVHSVTVVTDPATTVVAEQPTTVVAATTITVVVEQPTTVVATTTLLDNKKETQSQASSSALVNACRRHGLVLDAAAERTILKRCRTYDKTASDDEIAYFAEVKINQLRQSRNIANLVGLLITAIPEYFVEPAHELQRYRAGLAEQRAQHQALARKILNDSEASETDRTWASALLEGHGNT